MKQTRQQRTRRQRYDLREFWPWYERSWPVRGPHATPPPFTLNDIADPRRTRVRVLPTVVSVLIVAAIVWLLLLRR